MSEYPTFPGKTRIMARIRSGRTQLEQQLEKLTENQMLVPNVEAAWSVKDILAHITSWEILLLDRLLATANGTPPQIPPIHNWDDVDKYNADTYTRNKDRELAVIQEEFQAAHQKVLETLAAFNDAQLIQPAPLSELDLPPIWRVIAENTYEHYQEHLEAIQNWLSK